MERAAFLAADKSPRIRRLIDETSSRRALASRFRSTLA
jgi:hypothetical protein